MHCSFCGQLSSAGTFCTACGNSLNVNVNAPSNGLHLILKDKRKFFLTGGMASVLVIALVMFLVFRSSPAVPYLKSACKTLAPVNFDDKNLTEVEAIEQSASSQIESALAVDPELAAPFSSILTSMNYTIDQQREASTWLALALTTSFLGSIYINRSSEALGNVTANNIKLEADIQTACANYK